MAQPSLSFERLHGERVAGIDEAGRGPWAGPVVAACVLFHGKIPRGINDSKQLPAPKRIELFDVIRARAHIGVGFASAQEIDALNILGATKLAMQRAYAGMNQTTDTVLVDGNQPPTLPCRCVPVIKGDSLSLSIAAASIIAKVTRDRLMQSLAMQYPGYGWERNAGYPTREHLAALARLGLNRHHRRGFGPCAALLGAGRDGHAA